MPHLLLLVLASVCGVALANNISCLDESGSPVDWWLMYGTAVLPNHPVPTVAQGKHYMYMDSRAAWAPSRLGDVTAKQGALFHTYNQFYELGQTSPDSVAWLMFSDSPPVGSAPSSRGHIKGGVLTDADGGVRISHSVPKFPPPVAEGNFSYSDNGLTNAQHMFCVSYNANELDKVGKELQYNYPYLYETHFPSSLQSKFPELYKASQGSYVNSEPNSHIQQLSSRGGASLVTIAKGAKWSDNLYQLLVSNYYDDDLLVQTWTNGAGGKMSSYCAPEFDPQVENIDTVVLDEALDMSFATTKDHSKWAITRVAKAVCLCDVNRMESQFKRGGGCTCLEDNRAWTAMRSVVDVVEEC